MASPPSARHRRDTTAAFLLAFVICTAARALAQVSSGGLAGVIRDAAGADVQGVRVEARELATGRVHTTRSNEAGRFLFPSLTPGRYVVTAAHDGFRAFERHGLRVSTGEVMSIDVTLEIGGPQETLVVRGEASPATNGRMGLGQVVTDIQVEQLPLNGRSFVPLVALAPGVALPPGSSLPRINGGRPRTNEYIFDGISVLQPEPGQVPFFPVIDAIQEFRVETNSPPAEFGRFNGGVINLTTRSGGNEFAGSLFTFLRHEALNAHHPFASPGPESPRFRRNQFGGVLGGPVARGHTFFFVDYQGQRQTIARTVISTVPTRLQRQGVFTEAIGGRVPAIYDPATTTVTGGVATRQPFPNNAIPGDRFDPVARTLLDRYPFPTRAGTANNFDRTDHETVDQDQFGVRLDHRVTERGDRVFGRLTRFRETFNPVAALPDGSGATTGALGPQRTHSWAWASSYRQPLSGTLLHELRFGDTGRTVQRSAVQLPTSPLVDLGLPGIPTTARFPSTLPSVQIGGYEPLGSPVNTATDFGTSVVQLADTLTWLRGAHVVKVGADLRWASLDVVQPPSPTGLFQFGNQFTDLPGVSGTGTPLASFLLGQVQTFSIDLQDDNIRNRAHVQEYFVQDDWQVSDRLTISGGVRYTLNFPSTEASNQAAVLNFETRQLDYLGQDGHPRSARELEPANLGPRLGLIYRPARRDVIRGGYAVVWIEQAGITTPFTTPAFPFLQTATARALDNATPAFVLANGPAVTPVGLTPDAGLGQGVFGVDRTLGSGYAQQWHAGWRRELGAGFVADVAYAGSFITRVGVPDANLNQLTLEQLALGPILLERVPNPYAGIIPPSSSLGDATITRAQLLKPFPEYTAVSLYRHNIGTTRYDAVEARLERRFSGGLSLLISYTRSRLVDDASSVFDASVLTGPVANAPVADAFDRSRDRDYSTGDIPHVFVASAVAELPWGRGRARHPSGWLGALVSDWTITAIATLQSGLPVAVTQSTNFNAFAGFGTQRPNLVGHPELPASERSTARWFNTDAFAVAPQFTLGTASRNPVRGPAYRNLDLALIRQIPLPGGCRLDLRAEAFNLTNTPAWGAPNGVLGSPAFGSITSAGDPRVIQLAARVRF